jgi:hypothetical protein
MYPLGRNIPISTGARKHLVDAENVERVGTDPHVESLLTNIDGQVLVSTDTRGFKALEKK